MALTRLAAVASGDRRGMWNVATVAEDAAVGNRRPRAVTPATVLGAAQRGGMTVAANRPIYDEPYIAKAGAHRARRRRPSWEESW